MEHPIESHNPLKLCLDRLALDAAKAHLSAPTSPLSEHVDEVITRQEYEIREHVTLHVRGQTAAILAALAEQRGRGTKAAQAGKEEDGKKESVTLTREIHPLTVLFNIEALLGHVDAAYSSNIRTALKQIGINSVRDYCEISAPAMSKLIGEANWSRVRHAMVLLSDSLQNPPSSLGLDKEAMRLCAVLKLNTIAQLLGIPESQLRERAKRHRIRGIAPALRNIHQCMEQYGLLWPS